MAQTQIDSGGTSSDVELSTCPPTTAQTQIGSRDTICNAELVTCPPPTVQTTNLRNVVGESKDVANIIQELRHVSPHDADSIATLPYIHVNYN